MRCPCEPCLEARNSPKVDRHPGKEARRAVAEAIRASVVRGDVIGGSHTVWTDWAPEADAAIAAYLEVVTDARNRPGTTGGDDA